MVELLYFNTHRIGVRDMKEVMLTRDVRDIRMPYGMSLIEPSDRQSAFSKDEWKILSLSNDKVKWDAWMRLNEEVYAESECCVDE